MQIRPNITFFAALMVMAVLASAVLAPAQTASAPDPYELYIKNSKDFAPVKQDKDWALKAWPSWTYMPWYYQWTIGHDDNAGKFCREYGYNGAFVDRGNNSYLRWINDFQLRFYMDHTAGKGDLHLKDKFDKALGDALHGTGVRTKPVNAEMGSRLRDLMTRDIQAVMGSKFRAAYALDDEISWGHFVHPTMWQITDDKQAYAAWLEEIYGKGNAPAREGWISYNSIQPKLKGWSVAEFDASALMDQWTFNDAWWANFLGQLVEHANKVDPATPCGFVGGQSPNAFGGYDYARIMRKVQFIESYNIGSSQAVIRSFNPANALPAVTTHFHKQATDDIWQVWYYLAHGNKGMIGWVEGWFDGKSPKPWLAEVAPTYKQANETVGPLTSGAEWIHDGVAIYYSHPSIQLGWIMDAEPHGKTWVNRNGDHTVGSSHLVRKAWENMLRDEGLQYNFISYVDVVQKGVSGQYKVLVLPGALCLSEAEARRIKDFCRNGGTVIADYLPGLWDQHGKGRGPQSPNAGGGVLDDMFGLKHEPSMKAGDVFGQKLWCETDQEENFSYKSYEQLLTGNNTCVKDDSGFYKAVRKMEVNHVADYGKGKAVLMNLSPQWYNAYRAAGIQQAAKREVFMKHVLAAGVKPWVRIAAAGEKEFGYEITYWQKDRGPQSPNAAIGDPGRTIVFVCFNPEIVGSSTGGGNAAGLKTSQASVKLAFAGPLQDVRDERAAKKLPDGKEFDLDWKMNEALVISFAGPPPK